MDLYEYQAKDLFAKHGVAVVPGKVCFTPEEAQAVATEIGTTVVVKAQVKTGKACNKATVWPIKSSKSTALASISLR